MRAARRQAVGPRDAAGARSAPRARARCSRPAASTNRYGFSRLTGVVARVVYGGFGKAASVGAPTTPEKTWFHTPLDQPRDLAVAGQPLLLRAVDDDRQVRVGDEAAARVLRAGGAVVHQRQVAAGDVEAAHRHRLRDGPEVRRGAAAVLAGGVDVQRQVGERAPEVDEREAVARAAVGEAAVVDLDLAVDRRRRSARRRGRRSRCSSRPSICSGWSAVP